MPVFISYRQKDRQVAFAISEKFRANNIKYYLDVVDEESLTTDDITSVITKNIQRCTHLIAVISANTKGSWWVPFEIGEATIISRRICSYAYKTEGAPLLRSTIDIYKSFLPEYLHKWPILVNERDIDAFIRQYKSDKEESITLESLGSISSRLESLSAYGADQFHKNLKASL
ncbi:toll/interleukin-1 receptor domain-containing protein [Acinetobacter baumannii]|uniref:Toll/interleukin-1 receptor domain-containing protein n=1 Tax=Acinetobacter oleivorans TaxID=1148157 RepID=A0ABR9NP32_9GAMM|nr:MULTISPECIES: toll/interleukin-1 receptor domain-containing protein [Acinetobacter]MBE2166451.1 toll/interleukin-1 receptor domain-containing protein [Acinetobacter oleivorans]MBN6522082.1 toll/interleukin-1 receptor domain-containing protein [Acinetobacter pittii]MDA4916994.1 toll/interleukin-1 receptor domain-containing protein [Acinetobacter baumannii]